MGDRDQDLHWQAPRELVIHRVDRGPCFGNDVLILPVETAHLSVFESLPHHHRDPFDRMVIAQAVAEDLVVIGADTEFKSYDIDLHW